MGLLLCLDWLWGGHGLAGAPVFLAGDIPALVWRVTVAFLPEVLTTLILADEDIAFECLHSKTFE